MTTREAPLLSGRQSSEQSSDRGLAEEDELLTGKTKDTQSNWKRWREVGFAIWAVVATLLVVVLAVIYQQSNKAASTGNSKPTGKRNLIFMVSDGMGPTSLSLTRSFMQYEGKAPFDHTLAIDRYTIGQSRTRSTSSLITDSAAGATAFSCGQKSYNGAISVLPNHEPCGTVLEAAKDAGYMTGLVVTTRITDATPACFAAHVNNRDEEDRIAEQLLGDYPLGQTVDLMLGAGRCHFLPNTSAGSCRSDDKDLTAMAQEKGFSYIDKREDFDNLRMGKAVNLPMLGLFANHDIPYEVDRRQQDEKYPALDEMAKIAMEALSAATRDKDQGFFLMIEGSRIDHAGHANDPVAQVHEVLAYDKAFEAVIDFLENDPTQGVMVSTSDHETGGLATARQLKPYEYPEYLWHPSVLANASHSVEWLSKDYHEKLARSRDSTFVPPDDIETYLRTALADHLGVHDPDGEEIKQLISEPQRSPYTFADIISRRSQTGWATHGHSAADVNIYTSDRRAAKALEGSVENTDVGEFLRDYLDVDTDSVTRRLKASENFKDLSWMGKLPEDGERLDGQSHEVNLDHYEGDFKKHKRCEICGM